MLNCTDGLYCASYFLCSFISLLSVVLSCVFHYMSRLRTVLESNPKYTCAVKLILNSFNVCNFCKVSKPLLQDFIY